MPEIEIDFVGPVAPSVPKMFGTSASKVSSPSTCPMIVVASMSMLPNEVLPVPCSADVAKSSAAKVASVRSAEVFRFVPASHVTVPEEITTAPVLHAVTLPFKVERVDSVQMFAELDCTCQGGVPCSADTESVELDQKRWP